MGSDPIPTPKLKLFVGVVAIDNYIVVKCQPDDSIRQLKELIEKGIATEGNAFGAKRQTLIYHSQTLKDDMKIQEYNIKDQDIIFMYIFSKEEYKRHKNQKVKSLSKGIFRVM